MRTATQAGRAVLVAVLVNAMASPMRVPVLEAEAAPPPNPGTYIPGYGGTTAPPRMFLVMDTSMSMRFSPDYSHELPKVDYDGQPAVAELGQVCGESGGGGLSPPAAVAGVPTTITGAIENTPITLNCGPGHIITNIEFAAFGKPHGAPQPNFPTNACSMTDASSMVDETSGCNVASSQPQYRSGLGYAVRGWADVTPQVEKLCVGESSCTVPNSVNSVAYGDAAFPDSCYGQTKYALVKFSCSADPCPTVIRGGVSKQLGSKFCIAKKALYNSVNDYDSQIEIATAGYYQLAWQQNHPAVTTQFETQCAYDVYSRNGNTNTYNRAYSTLEYGVPALTVANTWTTGVTCSPEQIVPAWPGASPLYGRCDTSQAPHTCRKRYTNQASFAAHQNPAVACAATRPPTGTAPRPWGTCLPPDLAAGSAPNATAINGYFDDPASHWDTNEYLYIRRSALGGGACPAAPSTYANLAIPGPYPWSITDVLHGHPGSLAGGLPGDCTAGSQCAYFNDSATEVIPQAGVTVYQDQGPPPVTIGATTYSHVTTNTEDDIISASEFANSCPATVTGYTGGAFYGSCASGGCDLSRLAGPTDNYSCPWPLSLSGATCTDSFTGFNESVAVTSPGAYVLNTSTAGYRDFTYELDLAAVQVGAVSCLASAPVLVSDATIPAVTGAGVHKVSAPLGCSTSNASAPGLCKVWGVSPTTVVGGKTILGTANTDQGTVTCSVRRYEAQYELSLPATNNPYCNYRRTDYTYYNTDDFCRYARFDYIYDYHRFEYRWNDNDGDYAGSYWVQPTYASTAAAGNEYCSGSNAPNVQATYTASSGFTVPSGTDRCQVELAPGTGGCPATALRCKLRVSDHLPSDPTFDRFKNFLPHSTYPFPFDNSANSYAMIAPQPLGASGTLFHNTVTGCQLSDPAAQASADPNNLPNASYTSGWTNWCHTSGTPYQPAWLEPTKVIADYYATSKTGDDFSDGYWGGTSPDVSRGDVFTPAVRTTKDRGLSFSNLTPLTAQLGAPVPAPSQVGFQDSKANRLKVFSHNTASNTLGLRMPDLGDITPLTGSLLNALDYIQQVRASDSSASCRKYSVLLVTDGDEAPLGNNPVAAVSALVNSALPGGPIDVYVVGFGVNSPTLDLMAQTAGTAVDSLGNPSPSGGAYSAADYVTLKRALDQIMGLQLSGFYTRSKPTVTSDGKRVYVGYFQKSTQPTSLEFFGYLDAYSTNTSGVVAPGADWKMSATLNSQTTYQAPAVAPLPRKMFTRHPMNYYAHNDPSAIIDFDEVSSCGGAHGDLTTAITGSCSSTDRAVTNDVVHYVRNDRVSPDNGTFDPSGDPRVSRVADVYHSQPAIDGPPFFTSSYTAPSPYRQLGGQGSALETTGGAFDAAKFTAAYLAYQTANSSKEQSVFIQTNDGVVHSLRDATTAPTPDWRGQERWGYVPRQLLDKLPALRQGHEWLADGSFAITDVCFGQSDCERADGSGWKTMLIGNVGRAGPYFFALDVTSPTAPTWLWDYNTASPMPDTDLGETWSTPVIARVGVDGDHYKWGAFVGGGYKDRNQWWDHTAAQFYVLETDPAVREANGSNDTAPMTDSHHDIAKWDLDNIDSSQGVEHLVIDSFWHWPVRVPNNVPGRARVVRPNDGSRASRVYFGDTEGKLWTMDVSGTAIHTWEPKVMFSPYYIDRVNSVGGCASAPITPLPDKCSNYPSGCPASHSFGSGSSWASPSLPWPSDVDGLPALFNRPYLGLDENNQATMVYVGSGDPTQPGDHHARNYFWAIEDGASLETPGVCEGKVRWSYYLSPGEKVLTEPVIIGPNIIVAVYSPPTGGTCGNAGTSILYCFDKLDGTPNACLYDTSTNPIDPGISGGRARFVSAGAPGIVSDLVAIGSRLSYVTDVAPDKVLGNDVVSSDTPFRIKKWRRVK